VRVGRVEALEREQGDGFVRSVGDESLIARTVVLATGAEDVAPPIADLDGAIHRGVLRHCPACDAYEVRDRRIAIIGAGTCRLEEALLRRSYSADLTVLSVQRELAMAPDEYDQLKQAGVRWVREPVATLVPGEDEMAARLARSGRLLRFDTMYSALGLRGRSEHATRIGAHHDQDGMLLVDNHQRTNVPGLYAVGDVVKGLTQIGVARGLPRWLRARSTAASIDGCTRAARCQARCHNSPGLESRLRRRRRDVSARPRAAASPGVAHCFAWASSLSDFAGSYG
jgi:thioredoxin reductase (NADPH)